MELILRWINTNFLDSGIPRGIYFNFLQLHLHETWSNFMWYKLSLYSYVWNLAWTSLMLPFYSYENMLQKYFGILFHSSSIFVLNCRLTKKNIEKLLVMIALRQIGIEWIAKVLIWFVIVQIVKKHGPTQFFLLIDLSFALITFVSQFCIKAFPLTLSVYIQYLLHLLLLT